MVLQGKMEICNTREGTDNSAASASGFGSQNLNFKFVSAVNHKFVHVCVQTHHK